MKKSIVSILLVVAMVVVAVGGILPAGVAPLAETAKIMGDADGDGAVTTSDARRVLMYCVGKVQGTAQLQAAADVDGDSYITSTDARVILQYCAEKIDKFPCEEERAAVGATVPFLTYEAEDAARSSGATLGNVSTDYYIGQSASGKQYVSLPSSGSAVEFTSEQSADRITIRYGATYNSTAKLAVVVGGTTITTLTLNTVQCYDNGGNSVTARRFTETSVIANVSKGTKIKLINKSSAKVWIDLIDLETAPAKIAKPANSLSITDYGATANDNTDDANAISSCIEAASRSGKQVYIPEGTFIQSRRITVPGGVDIVGAGIWYSNIDFTTPGTTYSNTSGYAFTSGNRIANIHFTDRVSYARDNATILFRPVGNYQVFENCWFSNIGCVFGWDDEALENIFRNNRIIGTYFDGIHWGDGRYYKNEAYNNYFRGIGDDAIAQVNRQDYGLCEDNYAHHNTIVASYWGRGLALVGGKGLKLCYNRVMGTFNAGLIITTETLGGSYSRKIEDTLIEGNVFTLCGHNYNSNIPNSITASNHATIHVWLSTNDATNVIVRNNVLSNGLTGAIQLDKTSHSTDGITFENNTITGFN